MSSDAITRAELESDQARQEMSFATALFQLERRMMAMERRIYLLIAVASSVIIGAVIGAMQLD